MQAVLPITVALDTGSLRLAVCPILKGITTRGQAKTALLNDKFSRAVFACLYFFPPLDIVVALFITSRGPRKLSRKVFVTGISPACSSRWRSSHLCINSSTRLYWKKTMHHFQNAAFIACSAHCGKRNKWGIGQKKTPTARYFIQNRRSNRNYRNR